jgi:hypothetical protein
MAMNLRVYTAGRVGCRLWIGGIALLLSSCKPLPPPDLSHPEEKVLADPLSAPPVVEVEDTGEPDWQARYREWRDKLHGTFRAYPTNKTVVVRVMGGAERQGKITRIAETEIDFQVVSGVVTYPRGQLAMETRARIYEEDYLHAKSRSEVLREREAYRSRRQAERAEAARRVAAAQRASSVGVADRQPLHGIRPGPPVNDPDDRSVWHVKNHLEHTLQDPDSIEYISWSPVMRDGDTYRVVCTYRAWAGSFGIVTEKKVFFLNAEGQVTAVSPVRHPGSL